MIITYGVIHFLRQDVQLRAKLYTTVRKFNNAGTMCLERRWELRFSRGTKGYAVYRCEHHKKRLHRKNVTDQND